MWTNIAHNKQYGPFSAHIRREKEDLEGGNSATPQTNGVRDRTISQPTEGTRVPSTEAERELDEKDENDS
jgi:hypothetical protein